MHAAWQGTLEQTRTFLFQLNVRRIIQTCSRSHCSLVWLVTEKRKLMSRFCLHLEATATVWFNNSSWYNNNVVWPLIHGLKSKDSVCEGLQSDRGSHDNECGEYYLLGCDVMLPAKSLETFRRNVLFPSSELESRSNKQVSNRTLEKIEAIRPSETAVNFYHNTRRHITDDGTTQGHN
jgi:hypothetical protein